MSVRIQVVVDPREREAFRSQAAAEGRSLSEWLRVAGRQRLADAARSELRTAEDLERFFAACDEREDGREPDWDEHLEVIRRSRTEGLPTP
jgi:hypothetical protein